MPKDTYPSKCSCCGEQSHFGRCIEPGTYDRHYNRVYIGPVRNRRGKVLRAGHWRKLPK